MKNVKSGSKTLMWSVIMSSPGPLLVGLGLLTGRSATQLADFVRRSSELLAIVMSFFVYKITTKDGVEDVKKKQCLERYSNAFVGVMMCVGATIMILLAFLSERGEKGNVVPGLLIAVAGVIANTVFWHRYAKLNRTEPNVILKVQARLYRAKSFVDACVTVALIVVLVAPASGAAFWFDLIGSVIVALYLIWSGIKTIAEAVKGREKE